jgi:long-chain acyl-CoA synthetase
MLELKPDAPSTSFAPRRRTWRQTAERVGRVAGALQGLGVERGDRVAILAHNTDRYFELMYAVAWVGGTLVPIDTRLSTAGIARILDNSRAIVLFIDGEMAHHLTKLEGHIPGVNEVVWIDDISSPDGMLHYEDMTAYEPIGDLGASGDDQAGVFYDGDRPEGVTLTHANMVENAGTAVSSVGFDGNTAYLHASPMFELVEDALTFGVTLAGGRHVFVPRFEPREVLEIIAADKVTHAQLTPAMIASLLDHPRFAEFNLSSLSSVLHGNRDLPAEVLSKAHAQMPGVRFIDGDGKLAA